MSDRGFKKHFDGRRFYNPDAHQVRGFLDVLRWKLSSRPESSPEFVSDVEQSTPPRRVEGSELRITLVNHSTVLIQQGASNILTGPNLVGKSQSCVLVRPEAPSNTWSANG